MCSVLSRLVHSLALAHCAAGQKERGIAALEEAEQLRAEADGAALRLARSLSAANPDRSYAELGSTPTRAGGGGGGGGGIGRRIPTGRPTAASRDHERQAKWE